MRKAVSVIVIISSLLIVGCTKKKELNYTVSETDGIKTYYNKNIPSDPNFRITPKEVFTIEGFGENAQDTLRNFIHPHDITVDSQGNIYVLDSRLSSIKKFDKNGEFLISIGKRGQGPGEMQEAWQMLILNDTLYVSDATARQNSVFELDGDFVRNLRTETNDLLNRMYPLTVSSFITSNDIWEEREGELYYINDLQIRNSKFEFFKSLCSKSGKYEGENMNFHDYSTSFSVGKNQIYIAKNSTDEYCIDVANYSGELLYKIKKDFRKVAMPIKDTQEFAKSKNSSYKDNVSRKFDIKYKKAVNDMGMFVDKNGYLLVQVPLERNQENEFDFVVDAFKDGIFINRFKLDIGKAFDYYNSDHKRWFIGNRIYYQNREDNCITVYEY